MARAMGHGPSFDFQTAEDVWNEIRNVWPAAAGITYRRLDERGLQWPCPTEDHPGTSILHTGIFTAGSRSRLQQIDYAPTAERTSTEYPLLLVTGRALYQFNAGTMTGRSRTALLQGVDVLRISPADAARYGIADGQRVCLRSRYGEVTIGTQISDRVRRGEVFATFQSPDVFLNRVTSPHRDDLVHTPEYKVTAVEIEPVRPMAERATPARRE